jgi:hypothetical protein
LSEWCATFGFVPVSLKNQLTKTFNMKQTLVSFATLFFIFSFAHAQDKIYRNNGKIVEAKILEIGSEEIKYKEFHNQDGPIYVLETDRIKKIVFENGKVQKFEDNYKDSERYEGQMSKAVKFNFLSPLYGYTEIGFEKSTSVGKGYEISLGIIGLGKSETLEYEPTAGQFKTVKRNQAGAFVSAGYKFNKLPDFIIFGKTRMSHLMQGTYAKPIIYFGHYNENQILMKANVDELTKQHITFGALQIEIGKEWVLGDKFLLDSYWGIGYGVDNKKDTYYWSDNSYNDPYSDASAFNYANGRVGRSPGFSASFGIKFGMLIK